MSAVVFPTPSSASLPPTAVEKVYEVYSPNGSMRYRPNGGLPAGKYAVQIDGLDANYLEVTAPGVGIQGKGTSAFFQVESGGFEIEATACTFADSSVISNVRRFSTPLFQLIAQGYPAYSFTPGNLVAKHNGKYILMSGQSTDFRVYTSSNGASWTQYNSGANYGWTFLGDSTTRSQIMDVKVMGNYLYAMHGIANADGFYRTADLTGNSGWSRLGTQSGWNLLQSPVAGSDRIFVFGNSYIYYSDNFGVSWTSVSGGATTSHQYLSPVVKGTDIYALASTTGGVLTTYVVKSTNNGASWSIVYTFPNTNNWPVSLAYSPTLDRFVVANRNANQTALQLEYSSDNCVTFTNSDYNVAGNTTDLGFSKVVWFAPAAKFVASVKNNVGELWQSSNGINWTFLRDVPGTGNSILLATSDELLYKSHDLVSGALGRTTDLVNFNESAPSFSTLDGVAYTNGIFVATNGTSTCLRGPALDALEPITTSATLTGVVGGQGIFLARASSGRVARSTDGITWTFSANNFMDTSFFPSYVGGYFIIRGQNGEIRTSIDGQNWTTRATIASPTFVRVKKVKDYFITVGGTTTQFMYSTDLVNWTISLSGTNNGLSNITYSEDQNIWLRQFPNNTVITPTSGLEIGNDFSALTQGPTGGSEATSAGQFIRMESVAGMAVVRSGYVAKGGSNSTTDREQFKVYFTQNTGGSIVRVLHDTDINENVARSNAMLVSLAGSRNGFQTLTYGKPAVFTVYRLRD